MSEEQTERFEGSTPFETRVLRELATTNQRLGGLENRMERVESRLDGLEVRLTGLEEKVDARLRETRPIWENVLSQLEKIDAKLNVLGRDLRDTRGDVEMLKKRLPAT